MYVLVNILNMGVLSICENGGGGEGNKNSLQICRFAGYNIHNNETRTQPPELGGLCFILFIVLVLTH